MTTCPKCGAHLNGLLAHAEHSCYGNKAQYHVATDNEMRNAFIELGAPSMLFDLFDYTQPTKMERVIFERSEPEEEPEPAPSEEDIQFEAVFQRMTEDERWELLLLSANGTQQGNMMIYGAVAMEKMIAFKDKMKKKYGDQ